MGERLIFKNNVKHYQYIRLVEISYNCWYKHSCEVMFRFVLSHGRLYKYLKEFIKKFIIYP